MARPRNSRIEKLWGDYLPLCKRYYVDGEAVPEIHEITRKIQKEMLKEGCPQEKVWSRFNGRERGRKIAYLAKTGLHDFVNKRQKLLHSETRRYREKDELKSIKLPYRYCVVCKTEKHLEQHHIKRFRTDKENNSPQNIVWLCFSCHLKFGHPKGYHILSSGSLVRKLKKLNPLLK